MFYDEMLSVLLFYIEIFDVCKLFMVDVIDFDGLVWLQVIEFGWMCVMLNGVEVCCMLVGCFIEDSFGLFVQYIVFVIVDIFVIVKVLVDLGFLVLCIGVNYYDDVVVCFGFDVGLIDWLCQFNVMYDEDVGGQFFQLYFVFSEDGFFFEIVQWQGNYCGYGVLNVFFCIVV